MPVLVNTISHRQKDSQVVCLPSSPTHEIVQLTALLHGCHYIVKHDARRMKRLCICDALEPGLSRSRLSCTNQASTKLPKYHLPGSVG